MASLIAGGVSALLWLATLFCLPSVVRGRRRLLFSFLAVFALTMSLQTDLVFDVLDAALGGVNVTYYLFHVTAVIAVALLNELVRAASSVQPGGWRIKPISAIFPGVVILIQSVLFFGADWRLMPDIRFLDRWDYTAYAATTWVALAYFSVTVAAACLSDRRRQRRRLTRVSLGFVVVGCAGVIVYAVVSLLNAVMANVSHNADFATGTGGVYYAALLIAPSCLAVGFGLTAAVDGVMRVQREVQVRVLLVRLAPLWERLLSESPELSLDVPETKIHLVLTRGAAARLYRRYVEVRDCLLLYPQEISQSDQALLATAEHLASPAGPRVLPIVTVEGQP
ncbi:MULTISPECIES: MAB_1171c family putative transporter [Cryobacterium]|uniref:DUF6545 domain-containing protein n=1 Tax=Cryobacterium glucosi TaxID=1259175 RepID=A0ABY2INF8_9MICO|nr:MULTISPECIES: MAB_1171c family putative transporter [Cryobacterium]TFB98824.1 hypothetical protein E3O39_04395 [Cryobacterium sp. MDB2-A-1]TFC04260.1 hypothetical protein E3O59_14740 [Cryobacterium sp. MDB2-33-2]TFC14925.1 hypothetical protein E3O35_03240 [Cryobacterium sp. MDB2-A-2]TFC16433.1 hypothetical protein E3O51_12265 [Cryobacterium sp. MDB2-10]TFC21158.1 hypothetical protein E3O46_07535 [Cryobacterium glucosi]